MVFSSIFNASGTIQALDPRNMSSTVVQHSTLNPLGLRDQIPPLAQETENGEKKLFHWMQFRNNYVFKKGSAEQAAHF
jgi:hypothetical protein